SRGRERTARPSDRGARLATLRGAADRPRNRGRGLRGTRRRSHRRRRTRRPLPGPGPRAAGEDGVARAHSPAPPPPAAEDPHLPERQLASLPLTLRVRPPARSRGPLAKTALPSPRHGPTVPGRQLLAAALALACPGIRLSPAGRLRAKTGQGTVRTIRV